MVLTSWAASSTQVVRAQAYAPAATLADEVARTKVVLVDGYATARPRLLFGAGDRATLKKKAEREPALWAEVVASARRLGQPPAADVIAAGKTYWRVEGVQSAALVAFVDGDAAARDAAVAWMLAHCREKVWGTAYRPNLDLVASWYLYHCAVGYDTLHAALNDADRAAIRDGLADHARAIYDDFDPAKPEKRSYDQNHTYITAVALAAAALALRGEVPDADAWLTRAAAVLNRCRFALGDDGYYYEGAGYWTYALPWHMRYAELMSRATGDNLASLPALANQWKFGLHMSLPGKPGLFDVGDGSRWEGDDRPAMKVNQHAMLWYLAGANRSPESRAAGDLYQARQAERDYPATAFLWSAPDVPPAKFDAVEPFNHFADHGVVAWRSGWDDGATAVYFRCGPPAGHAATAKLKQMADWQINAGHVHPDIGAFYLYAKGAYLAVPTGYTAEKWTRDHNTLLIDGKGQGVDGAYWNDRGLPYEDFDAARIDRVFLSREYAFASGAFGRAYARQVKGVDVRRSLAATQRWVLVIDDVNSTDGTTPHTPTWLLHTDGLFEASGAAHVATLSAARLAVIPLSKAATETKTEPTIVQAGTAPGPGKPTRRGYTLAVSAIAPAASTRLVHLLVPLDKAGDLPAVQDVHVDGDAVAFKVVWPGGKQESVRLDLGWRDGGAGPLVVH
jgi:hypothetical protein